MASTPLRAQNSHQSLCVVALFLISFSIFFVLSFKPKPQYIELPSGIHGNPEAIITNHTWFNVVAKGIGRGKMKIALVNADDNMKHAYDKVESVEKVVVDFERVSKDLEWKDFFPPWIDEEERWASPRCPDIPMARVEDYGGLDVIVGRVPCGSAWEKEGIRSVFRLQVNLVVAKLALANGWVTDDFDRAVYVVFVGSCGPMPEIFRCDDLLSHVGDYWVYKPDMRKLRHKMTMPVGACQIAPPYAETGTEVWRPRKSISQQNLNQNFNHKYHRQRLAYATVLHSSEAYVCGAIALAQSIRQSNSTIDLVLLHDSSIRPKSLHGLRDAGWTTRLIQRIGSRFAIKGSYNEWNYSKLQVWKLLDYDKVIFIDSDFLVLRNIDQFFTYPQLSASPNSKMLFNSGIMVLEPSKCMFEDLMSKSSKLASYNGGDQGFLNEAFTWWHRLPSKLNYLKFYLNQSHSKRVVPNDGFTIHFLGLKPWMCYRDYDCNWDRESGHIFSSDSAHERWWRAYERMPKKLQQYCALTKEMDATIRTWRERAKNANLSDGHWKIKVTDPRQYHFVQ